MSTYPSVQLREAGILLQFLFVPLGVHALSRAAPLVQLVSVHQHCLSYYNS